jgi:hypothetical protein
VACSALRAHVHHANCRPSVLGGQLQLPAWLAELINTLCVASHAPLAELATKQGDSEPVSTLHYTTGCTLSAVTSHCTGSTAEQCSSSYNVDELLAASLRASQPDLWSMTWYCTDPPCRSSARRGRCLCTAFTPATPSNQCGTTADTAQVSTGLVACCNAKSC